MDTLVGMRTFRAVAEQGSFVAASKRMGLSPAATSKHVMRLEERLGVRLLNRNSRNVSLTDEGQIYLERLVETLDSLDEAEASVSEAVVKPRGHLIALRVSDNPGDHYIARPISEVVIEWVASPEYLKKAKHPKTLQDLRDHKILWYSEVATAVPVLEGGAQTTIGIEPAMLSGNETMLHQAALQGAGIAALPRWVTQDDKDAGKLVSVFKDGLQYRRPLLAVYQTRRHIPYKIRCFLDFLIDSPLLRSAEQ